MGELFAPAHLVLLLLLAIPALAIHFIPAIIAGVRNTENLVWILLLNIFLGWTLIGWIAALVWALRDPPKAALAGWNRPAV